MTAQNKNHNHFNLAMLFSFLGHLTVLLGSVAVGFLPAFNEPKIGFKGVIGVENLTINEPVKDKVKGEDRKLDPVNARPKPTPEPTPVPTPVPTPDDNELHKPQPTPIPTATPKPMPKASVSPTPTHTPKSAMKTPEASPAKIPVNTPKPATSPKSANTPGKPSKDAMKNLLPDDGPQIDRKGTKDGGAPPAGSKGMEVEGGINLPGEYCVAARAMFQENFHPPASTASLPACNSTIQFKVRRDGTIYDISVRESCGKPGLDNISKDAVQKTVKLPPLPLPDSFKRDYITIYLSFGFGGGQN